MIRLGLIGYPLGHSLSPVIHSAALGACGLEGSYSLFPIHPDDKEGLRKLLDRVRNKEITGLNVTIPHKQSVIEFLDELRPTAQAIGAVNTIYRRDNAIVGENTDAQGFLADLKRFLTTESQRRSDLNALVLGAGGSARAVTYALARDRWNVYLTSRRMEQAQHLADSFANYQLPITICNLTNLQSLISNLSLIVNTTPVGMAPKIDGSPWPENLPFPPHAAIYDLVYNPRETRFVRDARLQGRLATTGLGMLIEQAALAFEIWTGQNPSREVLRASLAESPVSNL
jgi:shikimate dehydrogenase